jgi:hypothetical protein
MPHTLADLGLSPERPIAWIPAVRGRTNEHVGVISFRLDAASGWEPEHLAVARSPEGDAALIKMLGLDMLSSGWARWSGALEEAADRGLCLVHQVPRREDGRYFVVAKTSAPAAAARCDASEAR